MKRTDKIRLFRMTHQMIESDLNSVERKFKLILGVNFR